METDYAKLYQKYIDEELEECSGTQWMTANAGQVRFCGGKDVEVNTLQTTGLGTYDSTKSDGSAYPSGTVTSAWTAQTLSMDRGVKFSLDRCNPEDPDFETSAENVIREFARMQLAKEQDCYRIHKLYALASADETWKGSHIVTYTPASDDIVEKLYDLAQTLENDSERTGGFVALVAADLKGKFLKATADDFNRIVFEQKVEVNGVTYEHVMMLNDLPCIFVPSGRMLTAIAPRSGRASQVAGGIAAGTGAKKIYALVTACDAPLAVAKIDSLKQFGPEENQLFDGTAIQARYQYDLFVPGTKVNTIGALVEG